MNNNPDFMANLTNRNGRPRGSKNKIRIHDIITDERQKELLEELYNIAMNGKYEKNRISAIEMLLERTLGRVPAEIHQNITDVTPFKELVNNRRDTTDDDNDI